MVLQPAITPSLMDRLLCEDHFQSPKSWEALGTRPRIMMSLLSLAKLSHLAWDRPLARFAVGQTELHPGEASISYPLGIGIPLYKHALLESKLFGIIRLSFGPYFFGTYYSAFLAFVLLTPGILWSAHW